MIFYCKKCKKKKNLHKVRLSYINNKLVCKEAICCDNYMDQIITDEYEGMPEIKRNEIKHSRQAIEEKFNNKMKGE